MKINIPLYGVLILCLTSIISTYIKTKIKKKRIKNKNNDQINK